MNLPKLPIPLIVTISAGIGAILISPILHFTLPWSESKDVISTPASTSASAEAFILLFLALAGSILWRNFQGAREEGQPHKGDDQLKKKTVESSTTTAALPPRPPSKFWYCVKATLVWLVILGGFYWIGTKVLGVDVTQTFTSLRLPPPHPNFRPRKFCTPYKVHDLSNEDLDEIHIPLTDGCYGDRWILPTKTVYEIQKSQNVGDYGAVWCNGHRDPGPVVEYYTDGMGPAMEKDCKADSDAGPNFRLQGRGELILTRTVEGPKSPPTAAEGK